MPVSPVESAAESADVLAAGTVRPDALLAAVGLRKSFGPTAALTGATLDLAAGELVAVLGTSGSGKSTLLHCLAGLIKPDEGTVSYRGQDLGRLSDAARSALRRSDFGFVFQFGQLVPELDCLTNVALPLRLNGLRRRAAEERALAWLERLEVAELAAKRPGELSGGQGQRVAIARALVTDPAVVFADEPTGSLDSLHSEQVMALLGAAAREAGAAVLLVTHDLRVAAYADREIVVRDGHTGEAGEEW
ncbi:ABC transporter ATP-binding protein [Kitasatospora sp. NBC_01287]|uniref:ABC transporter ATP-binding protein n=1 Tax=Kitasatospora sp. NBC_01287 TaxID=2903573 RepID=UPI002254FACC|nr:ABC transporter ATP-binding protein [Kitasatospora sp. NBC_01287]MCX4744542.1 ABC transporter ATP-binding protein [Kitasatospora sp. NBC_01287]